MATMMEPNPVTGVKEPYFPKKTQMSRMLTGSMVIIMMVSSINCKSSLLSWPVCRGGECMTASENEIQIKIKSLQELLSGDSSKFHV